MALKKYKPTTPGQRFKVISAFDEITTDKPEKSLLRPKKSTGGRNSSGEMTVRYRGGGHTNNTYDESVIISHVTSSPSFENI